MHVDGWCTTIILNEFRKFIQKNKEDKKWYYRAVAALHIKWLENKDGDGFGQCGKLLKVMTVDIISKKEPLSSKVLHA
jgi:hypothetical protein